MESFGARPESNRRRAQRYKIRTALRVRVWNSFAPEERAVSIDLSERGIFFATNKSLQKGENVEILLKMPEDITGKPTTEWLCTGPVVRVEQIDLPEGKMGVGVRFDCYQVSRSNDAAQPRGASSTRVWPREPRIGARASISDRKMRGQKGSFVVEFLIVVAIMAIIMVVGSIGIPNLLRAREAAKQKRAASSIRMAEDSRVNNPAWAPAPGNTPDPGLPSKKRQSTINATNETQVSPRPAKTDMLSDMR